MAGNPQQGDIFNSLAQSGGQAVNTLQGLSGLSLGGPGINTLSNFATSPLLFGSGPFNEAVQASMRAAQPRIASTFSRAGSGGLKSGLAQIGMQQAASDSFANLFNQERNRQLAGAQGLGSLQLGDLSRRAGAASGAGNLAIGGAGMLNNILNSGQDTRLRAAGMLPEMGLLGSNIMQGIGGLRQGFGQRLIDAPIAGQQQLFNNAISALPLSSLIGQSQDMNRNQGAGFLGGAMGGASIANAMSLSNPWTAALAIGGGLLGSM
jgi:hypothetical protein